MARPIVIAHRGASGYLPEHTLVTKALAFGMGADFLEQDVVATRDGQLLVFHDLTLDHMTDVAGRYPGRARPDGRFYCIDFDLAEIRALTVGERRAPDGTGARYPARFPDDGGRFSIATLDEELAFIRGLMRSTGRQVGIYPEIKSPAWHREQGIDIGPQVLATLARHGYATRQHSAYLQCFEAPELERLREQGCALRMVQLIDGDSGRPSPRDLARIARYADGIGPSMRLIYLGARDGKPELSPLVADTHGAGLVVHPYTFRKDDLPAGIRDFESLLELFFVKLRVDGLFTDFPDIAARFVTRHFPG